MNKKTNNHNLKRFKSGDILIRLDRIDIIRSKVGDNKYKVDRFTHTNDNIRYDINYHLYMDYYEHISDNLYVSK